MRRLPAAALLIVSTLVACDNVKWGGAQVEFVPPPPSGAGTEIAPDEQVYGEFGLPRGSVLFHVVRTQDGSLLLPVGEVSADSLRHLARPAGVAPEAFEARFRETVVPIGAEFRLFRRGAPVGTFIAQRDGPVTPCGLPTVYGNATVVAAAADAGEFLAFRRGLEPEVTGEYTTPQVTGSMRTYVAIVAERLILQAGLPRPRSWTGAQRDLQPIEVQPGGHPEMAATFLVGDSLAPGPADVNGYSVFYMADYRTERGYDPIYSEVHDYRTDGKAALRMVDFLDWDGAPGYEMLLQVYRRQGQGHVMLSEDGGRWKRVWESPTC